MDEVIYFNQALSNPSTAATISVFWGALERAQAACDNQDQEYWIAYPNNNNVADMVIYINGPAGTTGMVQSVKAWASAIPLPYPPAGTPPSL